MSSVICVDASLSLKIFLNEPDSQPVRDLWARWQAEGTGLIAPSLWAYEVVSVIRNQVYRKRVAEENEEELIRSLNSLPIDLLWPLGLHRRAWELARYFKRPTAYDMHYVALAEMADCPFWTADEKLFHSLRAELKWVHSVSRETTPG